MDQVEVAKVAEYAGEDADATWRIEAILAPKVRDEGLWDLYADLERPLIRVLAGWRRPASRSTSRGSGSSRRSSPRRLDDDRGGDLPARPGHAFNIGSLPAAPPGPLRRAEAARRCKKTPGGEPSTDVEVLEELAREAPAAPAARSSIASSPSSRAPISTPCRRWSHRGRPDPRLVQPGGRGDRPAQLERPEPPEHPDPDRGRPADPPGVRRRASRAGRS